MSETESNGLYTKILSKEGLTGLLLFMFSVFLMTIIYNGQNRQAEISMDILNETKKSAQQITEMTEVMKDIRYSIKADKGISSRN